MRPLSNRSPSAAISNPAELRNVFDFSAVNVGDLPYGPAFAPVIIRGLGQRSGGALNRRVAFAAPFHRVANRYLESRLGGGFRFDAVSFVEVGADHCTRNPASCRTYDNGNSLASSIAERCTCHTTDNHAKKGACILFWCCRFTATEQYEQQQYCSNKGKLSDSHSLPLELSAPSSYQHTMCLQACLHPFAGSLIFREILQPRLVNLPSLWK